MKYDYLDRNLALEAVRVTELAALSSSMHMGRGNEKSADQSAVNAMRDFLNELSISGKVVIGEGERDEAPMLYIGENLGTGNGPSIDIAVDPLEGTNFAAKNLPNALSVLAVTRKGNLLHAPDIYMEKIAVGKGLPRNLVDLDYTVENNQQCKSGDPHPNTEGHKEWAKQLKDKFFYSICSHISTIFYLNL